jgi:hypothetical protein
MARVQTACAGLALAAAVAWGSGASATQVYISDGQMDHPLIVQLAGANYNGDVYDGAMQFKTTFGSTPNVDLIAFCVDIFHDINFGPYSPSLPYQTTVPFTTDSRPSPGAADQLSSTQIEQIDRLVNYGTEVQKDGSLSTSDKSFTVGAVQGAIWEIVGGETVTLATGGWSQNNGVDATSFNTLVGEFADAGHYADQFDAKYGVIGDSTTFITPVGYPTGPTQSFLFAGSAPEPSTWLMAVMGIGLLGGALRLRRRPAGSLVEA